jgi:hypothetical protein
MAQLGELVGVAFGSGLTVKLMDILYQEIRSRRERGSEASRLLERQIDPFLKSLDEIVGKFRSLAGEDFSSLNCESHAEMLSSAYSKSSAAVMYLLTSFWARIEILRRDSLFADFARSGRGKQLHEFVKCLESRQVRLVDRGTQRACAELTLDGEGAGSRLVPYVEYCRLLVEDKRAQHWMTTLASLLARSHEKRYRQILLMYGVILHAMMDTLDPERHVTSSRPPFPNKLSRRTRRDLQYRVFAQYLPFVANPGRYFSHSQKNGGPQR